MRSIDVLIEDGINMSLMSLAMVISRDIHAEEFPQVLASVRRPKIQARKNTLTDMSFSHGVHAILGLAPPIVASPAAPPAAAPAAAVPPPVMRYLKTAVWTSPFVVA